MTRSPRCGQVLRRLERPGRPVLEDPVCGWRRGHRGQHLSEEAIQRRRYARRAPSGSPAIAAAVRDARKYAGLSQRDLARKLGVTQASVKLWEGAQRTPAPENWVQLELTLGPLGVVREAGPETAAMEESDAAA